MKNGELIEIEKHRAKGIQAAAASGLRHADYLQQLKTPAENYLINRRIGSAFHEIYSIETRKRALCAFDDKRFLLPDGLHSLAHGHKDIPHSVQDIFAEDDTVSIFSDEQAIRQGVTKGQDNLRQLPMFQPGMDPRAAWIEWREHINHIHEVRNSQSQNTLPELPPLSQVHEPSEIVASEEVQPTDPDLHKEESWDDTLDMINEIIREHGEQPMSAEEIAQLRNEPGFDFDEDPFGLADYI